MYPEIITDTFERILSKNLEESYLKPAKEVKRTISYTFIYNTSSINI